MKRAALLFFVASAVACAPPVDGDPPADDAGFVDAGEVRGPGAGTWSDPIAITLPFHADSDSTSAPADDVDAYGCDPGIDESGREIVYSFTLAARSTVSARITEDNEAGVDVDAHLLGALSADACIARGHHDVSRTLDPGTYFLVVDTWVDASGPHAGPYALDIDARETTTGDCAMADSDIEMFWDACALADCSTVGDARFMHLPSTGPVVKEAHLVTTEDGVGAAWPSSRPRDGRPAPATRAASPA